MPSSPSHGLGTQTRGKKANCFNYQLIKHFKDKATV